MKKSNVILIIYNILIGLFIIIIDWNDWGGVIALPILIGIVLVITPILTLILYRRSENKPLVILKSFIITIVMSTILFFIKYEF